ncbi:alpha beta-Hydrolase [Fusarium albosuccineum]|uniref:Alpha beta-Hydrolase n=1 Tax=Fusarium albosuccineum TaxID=1237068 RepID=A0A8H4LLH0_9HYPO|nr:alpha beta-Hydrolase [Fusarium albosuccineum]
MSSLVQPTGFTILQDCKEAELDIVFVHGLKGHPEKTWTYRGVDASSSRPPSFRSRFLGTGSRKSRGVSPPPSPEPLKPDVFWPKDLLSKHECCEKARIMTYGYDSDIIKMVDTANFTTITGEGQSLLNALARKRVEAMHRPLMFITHSLGGLIVKSALNLSFIKTGESVKDLRAVVDSTFSIIFFGTPHRGSTQAEFGLMVAKVVSNLTMKPYNPKILSTLGPNTEILTRLRTDFESTLEHMVNHSRFESSTFQEGKGFSSFKGFQGKVVEDDSSELNRNDRNDHIDRNHTDMCKFSGESDPEYDKVTGEIERHITRLQQKTSERGANLVHRLKILGTAAQARQWTIEVRTQGTLAWLYTAIGFKGERSSMISAEAYNLERWLTHGSGLFWITGRPGSGKSTTMRHLFESGRTLACLTGITPKMKSGKHKEGAHHGIGQPQTLDEIIPAESGQWVLIGLFITNYGDENQCRWETMMNGILLQLLKARPDLVHSILRLMDSKQPHWDHEPTRTDDKIKRDKLLMEILLDCKNLPGRPFKALIVLDALDELEEDESAREAVAFLKSLVDNVEFPKNTFKICVSSRAEQTFRDLFVDVSRIEVQDHTRDDIRAHVSSLLSSNPSFIGQPSWEIAKRLEHILDYISENAHGVFLWAHSVSKMVDNGLRKGASLGTLIQRLQELPTEMRDLYSYILKEIPPEDRRKVYIMFEVVLRARQPVSLLELFLIVEAALESMNDRETESHNYQQRVYNKTHYYPSLGDFSNAMGLQRQLIDNCRCMLEICGQDEEKNIRPPHILADELDIKRAREARVIARAQYQDCHGHQAPDPSQDLVRLLHRSARDFLLDKRCFDALFTTDGLSKKPPGNGHAFTLLFARQWIRYPYAARRQLRCNFETVQEVCFHAPLLEKTMSATDAAIFFPVLDDIDREASMKLEDRECWPIEVLYRRLSHWEFTFPAFAVANDMRDYMAHRLGKADRDDDRDHFLNGKAGRPLLHYAVHLTHQTPPNPSMAQFLIEAGADMEVRFEDKTAVENLLFDNYTRNGEPSLGILRVLIHGGADPNSHYYPKAGDRSHWHPLLHIVAARGYVPDIEPRLDFMRLLHRKGADLNGKDSKGLSFIEFLYWEGAPFPATEWDWLLRKGAKITKRMVSRTFYEPGGSACGQTEFWYDPDAESSDSSEAGLSPEDGEVLVLSGPSYFVDEETIQLSDRSQDLTASSVSVDLIPREIYDHIPSDPSFSEILEWLKRLGLCDKGSHRHDASEISRQKKFRRREWYDGDAAEAAETLEPRWFF